MTFFEQLVAQTESERNALQAIPIVQECLAGQVSLPSYVAFLTQAYHHVSQTVPLMRACRWALPSRLAWMQPALDEYIREEAGHDRWILDDLRACGVPRQAAIAAGPAFETEVMVAYSFDTIHRGHPLGFFGMVHVLEGTSVALALRAAERIQQTLRLPSEALRYLRSHSELDQDHTARFAELMDRLDDPRDQQAVVHGARSFYRLYGAILGGLPRPTVAAGREAA